MWHYNQTPPNNDWLKHYGISGQKWGVRRFQNPDGTYTEEGKKRYGMNRVTKENVWDKFQENYELYSSSHKDESRASQRFKSQPSLKEYFKIEDKVNRLIKEFHSDPKSKYMEFNKASEAYDIARKSGVSGKDLSLLKKKVDESSVASIQEDLWAMYQYVSNNYPKEQAPSILAMLYGGVYNHDYGD